MAGTAAKAANGAVSGLAWAGAKLADGGTRGLGMALLVHRPSSRAGSAQRWLAVAGCRGAASRDLRGAPSLRQRTERTVRASWGAHYTGQCGHDLALGFVTA